MFVAFFGLLACSDYSFDERKPVELGEDDTAIEPEIEEVFEPSPNPDILIEPNPIEFGYILKDCPSDPLTVTITNIGLDPLTVSDLYLDGQGSEAFTTTYDSAGFTEITLANGEAESFEVYFTPNLYRDFVIDLKVVSNDAEEATSIVPVSGTGSQGGLFEESFFQEYNTTVDVLWVIDNSCSMSDNVENVKNNFSSFLGSFLSLGLDYQMAITTTDRADNGNFKGAIMNSSQGQSYVEATFNSTLQTILNQAGTSSSQDTEVGLEMTKASLTANSSFIRAPDNGLSVILITDEDDNGSNITGNNFISWFQGLKPQDPTLVRMSAFLDANGGFGGNPTYDDVIQATQGYVADINAQNWSTDLEAIALAAAGLTVIFPLSQTPTSVSSISVAVNGQTVAQGIFNGWTYDSNLNALVFHGSSIPEEGSTVHVSYNLPSSCN